MSDGTQDRKLQSESPPPDSASQSTNRRSRTRVLGGWLLLIGTVLLYKAVIADHYLIPTDSMEPVLRGNPRFFRGDHVLVDKLAYGFRLPRTRRWLVRWRQPERGEIVVFLNSHDPARPVQIKRVAAVGGEEVRIANGRLLINGREISLLDEEGRPIRYTDRVEPDEETICRTFLLLARENRLPGVLNPAHPPVEALRQAMAQAHEAALQWDPKGSDLSDICRELSNVLIPSVRNTIRHLILHQTSPPRYGLLAAPMFSRIPEGNCFLLGDNSIRSVDGRIWGFTPSDHVFGRAVLLWRPPLTFRLLTPSPLQSPGFILTLLGAGFLIAWFLFELTSKVRRIWNKMRTRMSLVAATVTAMLALSGPVWAESQGNAAEQGNRSPFRDLYADTWVATDALGRMVPGYEETGPPRSDKWVGIFYWTWHIPRQGGPNDVTKLIGDAPPGTTIPWPQNDAPFHWGEPELGYYLATDPFVLRKHASMLADAGIDAIFFDTTNPPFTWKDQYEALCREFEAMRREGNATPYIAFICPFGGDVSSVFKQVWNDLYRPGRWRDLWFMWEGKPLILADPGVADTPEIQNFFTFRKPMPDYWLGPSGPDQWSWLEVYPQHVFRDRTGRAEQMSVGVAQNALPGTPGPAPMSHRRGAMGRSWHHGAKDPRPNAVLWGFNFEEQWRRALEVDPRFIFVTGWNEWVAGRYQEWNGYHADECYYPGGLFVDQYTQEYSRDCEPMRGGHTDNYYYQLASWVRRFKGVRPLPRSNGPHEICVDGKFKDWAGVLPEYRDTTGDVFHRDHPGYGALHYQNMTGRNDIIKSKSTYDNENIYFYTETNGRLSPHTDPYWMLLLIDLDQNAATGWLGYDVVVNDEVLSQTQTTVKVRERDGWKTVGVARIGIGEKSLEIAISGSLIGMGAEPPQFDFHWADNIPAYGDVSVLGIHGDSAPNRRWNYRFLPEH